ncbi:premnaspirodiene oxygenase-like [Phoenix dactylifera]|uniref:Premnaspirodiene oxygenase-like n=1 Tax=Phoenix dactylifera TaxID=42345 RepID=A0A8B7BK68_PHODC|nr:premnaspirodiene oxygenase-like [Phoenix dactylifera]
MELQLPSLPFLSAFLLFVLIVIKLTKSPASRKLPPSPWKLPIIGHLHHLLGALPHRALRELSRRHGPLMHLRLGQVDHIIVSSPEMAREILKTHDLIFASRDKILASKAFYDAADIIFAPYGSYWRELRKICVIELLSAKRVKSFSTLRQEEMSNQVGYISTMNNSPVNLSEMFLLISSTVTSRVTFGTKCKHGPRFISAMKKINELLVGYSVADLFPSLSFIDTLSGINSRLKKCHREMDEILGEIIKEHEVKRATKNSRNVGQQQGEDLVDILLELKENGGLEFPLPLTSIKAVIMDIFGAGTETSSTTLGWTMAELMRHPEIMEKVQAEVRQALKGKAGIEEENINEFHYMKLVIKESLRLHPPSPLLLPRVCRETCQVDGFNIPAGSRIIINAWAVARDPRYWEDPESFRPERFDGSSVDYKGGNFEYIPFGGGRRSCPGITFGLAQVEMALANLLYYFDWKLPNGMGPNDLDMTESFGSDVGLKSPLWLIATPYVPI